MSFEFLATGRSCFLIIGIRPGSLNPEYEPSFWGKEWAGIHLDTGPVIKSTFKSVVPALQSELKM